jgi:hypothetical protein
MNRIYQGRVTQIEIPNPTVETDWLLFHRDPRSAQECTKRIPELRQKVEGEIAAREKMSKEQRERTKPSAELQDYRALRSEQEKEWQDALWSHHKLFQDAVNYYAFALAVMAEGMTETDDEGKEKPTAMASFAKQLFERWEDFDHKGGTRTGLKHSLARTLRFDAKTITREQCVDRIFGHAFGKFPKSADRKLHDDFRGVIGELFPAKWRGTPQKLANEDPGWLCWKEKTGEPPAQKTYRNQQGLFDFMDRLFSADSAEQEKLSRRSVQESCLSGVVENGTEEEQPEQETETATSDELDESASGDDEAGYHIGQDAVTQLEACVKKAKALLNDESFRLLFTRFGNSAVDAENGLQSLEQLVKTKQEEEEKRQKENPNAQSTFRFQKCKRSGQGKDITRVELFLLFHCDGGSEFTAALLKAWLKGHYSSWLHSTDKRRYVQFVERFNLCGSADGLESPDKVDKARKAAAKPNYQPILSSVVQTDFVPRLRSELGYVFPSFTAMRGFVAQEGDPAESDGACKHGYFAWSKFDYAAYEEAIKSPHQIRQKQKEREKEAKQLKDLKKLYEGAGREKGKADDGEEEDFIPGGFSDSGDPRFVAMKRIHGSLAVADGADPTKLYRYGISQAALRGFEEVREAWNKRVGPADEYSGEKAKELKECIAAYQGHHRDDMGDSRFLEELTKNGNWCVWQPPKPEDDTERVKKRYSTNIVRDYLRYCDVLEDLEKKERPVQYTPADASESRRLFDFKGASQGGFEHGANSDGLSFTTQIAVTCCEQPNALYRSQPVRIHYTAPRLLRDEARVLSERETLQSANWAQPLMRALGIPEEDRHDFKKHAVSLMPDWKHGSRSPDPDRLLLNFVLRLKEDRFIAHLREQVRINAAERDGATVDDQFIEKLRTQMKNEEWPWTMQFNWNGDGHDSTLRWPHENWSKIEKRKGFPGFWFANANVKSFRLLSVDLGQKQAGAYAIIEVSCEFSDEAKQRARFIGRTEQGGERRDWFARVVTTGLLKLPGEEATVFRPDYKDGKPVPGSKDFRKELSGSAGRLATATETKRTIELLTELQQLTLLDDDSSKAEEACKRLTFPEQNTKLLIALRRAQSFASRLHRWCWFLDPQDKVERKDQPSRRRTAIKEIAEADAHEWLNKDAHSKAKARNTRLGDAKEEPEAHPEIVKALKTELEKLTKKLPQWLEIIANRTYHSRRGQLMWIKHPAKPDCHLLDFSLLTKEERNRLTKEEKWLSGQRGLSIERIDQLEELRKRWQSLNQMLRREIGCAPKASRDDSIPDPCPTILAKLDEIKEQRCNQTSHMILAQALGLTLAKPAETADDAESKLREAKDSHGEYVKADDKGHPVLPAKGNKWRGMVDFIVVEDLSRYRTSQGRGPRENSRLMKWCHRAIRDKLKQMCEPFGLPLVETPAAYSSRFCSRTGVAGFRATEVSGDPLEESKWRWRIRKPDDEKKETPEQRKRREDWEVLLTQVQAINKGRNDNGNGQQLRTLLVPEAGGSIFIPISRLNAGYERRAKGAPIIQFEMIRLEQNQEKKPKLIHADINAAVNLALRAVADPRLWSVHSRLRSEREFGTPVTPKAKKGKARRAAPVTQTPAEEIDLDRFWVSEKEKRKFGEANGNRFEIVLCSARYARERAEKAKSQFWRLGWLRLAQKLTPNAGDSRHPNFFDDVANLKTWIHRNAATLENIPGDTRRPIHLVTGKALWGYIKNQAWKRCMKINAARLRSWKLEPPKEWERP